jgi:hypothetical protein
MIPMRSSHGPAGRRLVAIALAGLVGVLATAPARAVPVLLSEILYDAAGPDDGGVFVELAGAPGTDLAGFTLEGVNGSDGSVTGSVALAGAIAADGLFVVADAPASGPSPFARVDLLADFDFQNGPDSVVLRDAAGLVLDAVGYGAFGAGEVFAGEGAAAPDAAGGESLARRFADVDTDDNAADFVVLAVPTPGRAPRAVPEPAALPLALLAPLWVAASRARGRRARPGAAAARPGP